MNTLACAHIAGL